MFLFVFLLAVTSYIHKSEGLKRENACLAYFLTLPCSRSVKKRISVLPRKSRGMAIRDRKSAAAAAATSVSLGCS